jgi:hypothetical protein
VLSSALVLPVGRFDNVIFIHPIKCVMGLICEAYRPCQWRRKPVSPFAI